MKAPGPALQARCPVPDERYTYLCDMWKPPSQYPAYLHITDIAGRGLHSFTSELKPSLRD